MWQASRRQESGFNSRTSVPSRPRLPELAMLAQLACLRHPASRPWRKPPFTWIAPAPGPTVGGSNPLLNTLLLGIPNATSLLSKPICLSVLIVNIFLKTNMWASFCFILLAVFCCSYSRLCLVQKEYHCLFSLRLLSIYLDCNWLRRVL